VEQKGSFRRLVSWAFAIITVIAVVVFEQAISAFATKQGWDQLFISGWKLLSDLGWDGAVALSFFALGGATLALWVENGLRDRRDAKTKLERHAISCTARFSFTKSSNGDLGVSLESEGSENVAYWAWYANNGGTLHNTAALLFIEFEKEISLPEIFTHSSAAVAQQWRQFVSTDRFIFVEMKGWPAGEVVVQAINSKSLGLDRRSELMVWRDCGRI